MKYKTEIKVYLPTQMVGELHRYKLEGTRSKFVEKAIRNRIDGRDNELTLSDFNTDAMMHYLREHRREEVLKILQGWFE